MIFEKVEAGVEPESERGGARSSAGMMSTTDRKLIMSLFKF